MMILIFLPIFNRQNSSNSWKAFNGLDTHDYHVLVLYKGYEIFGSNGFDIERPTHVNAHKTKGSICSLFIHIFWDFFFFIISLQGIFHRWDEFLKTWVCLKHCLCLTICVRSQRLGVLIIYGAKKWSCLWWIKWCARVSRYDVYFKVQIWFYL
jgi:hypothetical protein